MQPLELSGRYADAYNRRDDKAMRAMFHPEIVFVLPGQRQLRGVDAIVAEYQAYWKENDPYAEFLRSVEQENTVAIEVKLTLRSRNPIEELELAVIHEWAEDRLIRYRAYMDQPKPIE